MKDKKWLEDEIKKEMQEFKKIIINPAQLFNSSNDIRKYMRVDIRDEEYERLADEHGGNAVDDILSAATIYFRADKIPDEMELELVEHEPDLPVIPDYVAEYIEEQKRLSMNVYGAMKNAGLKRKATKIKTYRYIFFEGGMDDFIDAYRYDYTVKEEPKTYRFTQNAFMEQDFTAYSFEEANKLAQAEWKRMFEKEGLFGEPEFEKEVKE